MPSLRTLQRSFAGGEMSPSMHARVDDVRFQNGYASARNWEVLPDGSARRRPGLRHVRRCKHNDKRSRLIPFTFSADQTMQVEVGERYFRFHQNGGTLLYATPRVVATVDALANTLRFTARHGFANETAVQFTSSTTNNTDLPDPLVAGTTYFVTVIDPKTITVSATTPAGAAVNLTDAGAGTVRCWLNSEIPADFVFNSHSFAPAAVTTATDNFNVAAHGHLTGDAVHVGSTGTIPAPLVAGVTYYIIRIDANNFKLASSAALAATGTPIDITSQGAGGGSPHFVRNKYLQGDLVWTSGAGGTGHGVYYCKADTSTGTDPSLDSTSWYVQPVDGVYEIPSLYLEAQLPGITYDQSNDIVTLAVKDGVAGTFTTTADTDVDTITDTITETAHGLPNGTRVTVASSGAFPTATPAIVSGATYYIVGAATNTFQIATTHGGVPIDITADAAAGITLTWSHYTPGLAELRRLAALRWVYVPVTFAPPLTAPVIGTVTRTFGAYQEFDPDGASPTLFRTVDGLDQSGHGLQTGDSVFVEQKAGGIGAGVAFSGNAAGYYEVAHIGQSAAGQPFTDLRLKTIQGGIVLDGVTDNVYIRFASLNTETSQRYRVTAVTEDGLESQPSEYVETNNNLSVPGSSNLVSWSLVTNAARYHVYKKDQGTDGSYGFIGKADAGVSTFKDENIAPDLGRSLTTLDTSLGSAGNSPAAVTHFEQRRFFGGTTNTPNGIWATRSATEADLSFHIPLQDDDRLKFSIASSQAVSIRHLVSWKQLLTLTNATEFRIVPVDSEVLTPSSVDAKAHSYQGCSIVRPAVVSGNLVFCGARGGHVYEMGYQQPGGLSDPGDLCLRSAHLFDGHEIEDQALSKAPHQIIWFCSDSGLLLGLTYVPQEQIGAWHAHNTAASGVFESCSVTAEGQEDARYFIVRRTIGGSTVRSVEMMAPELHGSLVNAYFVDAGGTFDGSNTDATTMTVTGGVLWGYGESVTITASTIQFTLGSDDVGDEVVLTAADGTTHRIRITAVSTNKIATGTLLTILLPVSARGPTALWGFARDTIAGLDHLEGQTVQVFGDGLVQATKVVASGAITPTTPAVRGCVGLGYPTPMTLLPIGLQIAEAWGQGRTKNVNQAALRVVESGAFRIGPNASALVPANVEAVAGSLVTGESRVTLEPEWTAGGQVTLSIEDPLPLTLLGIVLQVSVGD